MELEPKTSDVDNNDLIENLGTISSNQILQENNLNYSSLHNNLQHPNENQQSENINSYVENREGSFEIITAPTQHCQDQGSFVPSDINHDIGNEGIQVQERNSNLRGRETNRIEEEIFVPNFQTNEDSETRNQSNIQQSDTKMIIEVETEKLFKNHAPKEIQNVIQTEQLMKTEYPAISRPEQMEEEENITSEATPRISSDERPIKGKGSYDFNIAEGFEPITRRNTTIGGFEEKIESIGGARTRAISTISEQNLVKTKSWNDERPMTGKGSYNILENERPISGKGAYNFGSELIQADEGNMMIESTNFPKETKQERLSEGRKENSQIEDSKLIEERPIIPPSLQNKRMEGETMASFESFQRERQINAYESLDERPLGNNNSSFLQDERPLKSARGNFDPGNEYPEGMDIQEDQLNESSVQDSGPLANRVKSKVWKVRQIAFEELTKSFSEAKTNDAIFQEYADDLTKFITDSNPGAQEKAVEAFKIFIQKQGTQYFDTKNAVKVLLDKVLGPGKPSLKKISNEVLFLLFERGEVQAVFDGINESMNHKNQKTSIAGIQAVKELLTNYGPKKLQFLKPFFPNLEKQAASTVSNLRNEAMNCYKEAYNFMGDALKPFLGKLKKAQQDELEKYFSENPKHASQPLKGDAENDGSLSTLGNTRCEDTNGSGTEFDPYEIVDSVDILKKFSESWSEKVLEQAKWSDKKALLDDLLKEATGTVKIANAPYQHITSLLKKTLNDNNITVIVTSIKIYAALAKGLRKNFSSGCKLAMPLLLVKLKDKRGQIISESCKALETFLYCISADEVIEDIKEALADKAPEMKIHTTAWVDKVCDKNSATPDKLINQYKNLLPIMKKLLDDSSGDVREAVMKLLAKWKVLLGDSVLKDSYKDIPQTKINRINELASALSTEFSGRGTAKTVSSSLSSNTPMRSKGGNILNESIEEEKVNVRTIKVEQKDKKPVGIGLPKLTKSLSTSAAVKKGPTKLTQGLPSTRIEEETSSVITQEDAENKMIELGVPGSIVKDMNENAWKEKLRGLNELNQWIEGNITQLAPYLEYFYRYLKAKLKDWKESNLNILKETFNLLIKTLQSKETTLTKKAFSLIAPLITNNIHETKYLESCQTIVYAFIEAINPKSVILSLANSILDAKNSKPNPKTLVEICNLFSKLVEELTLKFVPLKELVEFTKAAISNVNPAARTAATNLFKAIYQQMGPPLTDMINDINPQTLKVLTAEFDKIVPIKEAQCKIQFREDAENEIQELANTNPLDSLPRIDISKEVSKVFKKLTDNDWKVRKEGLDVLEGILSGAGNRILPNGLYDLVEILKERLKENNKSQAKSFICFVGKFASALGSGAKTYAKDLVFELVKNLSDKQAAIRQEALNSLQKFTIEVGSVMIINTMLPMLKFESPEMRSEIMNWILKNTESLPKAEIKPNISYLLGVLQDKNKDIRNLAEKLLERCISTIGTAPFLTTLKDVKPAIQNALKPTILKYRGENEMEIETPNITTSDQSSQQKTLTKTISDNNLKSKIPLQKTNTVGNIRSVAPPINGMPSNQKSTTKTATPRKVITQVGTHHSSFYQPNTSYDLNTTMPLNSSFQSVPSAKLRVFNVLGQKTKREEEERFFAWSIEELQDESVDRLKENLQINVSPDLYAKMFSVDSKRHLDAIRILKQTLVTELQGTVDVLDLLSRWFFLRLWDNSNSEMMKQSLDYLLSLLQSLENARYDLLEFEANVLIACLIPKLGTSHPNVKLDLCKVFLKLTSVFPSSKISLFLLHGMNSTNPHTRIECMDVLAKIIKTSGPGVLVHKDIKVFGRLLGHTDSSVREKSLNIILEIGRHIGEEVLSIIEQEAPSGSLEHVKERIADIESLTNQEEGHGEQKIQEENHQPLYNPVSPNKLLGTINPLTKQIKRAEVEETDEDKEKEGSQERNKNLLKKVDPQQFNKSMEMLISGNVTNKLDALLQIYDIATSEEEENKQFFRANVNVLILALKSVLMEVFDKPRKEIPAKFLIYFLNMTHKLCSIKVFLKNVSEENLRQFSEEVLNRLLSEDEERESKPEENQLDKTDSESLVKTLNSTMLRTLENSDPNNMFCVLFDLLIENRRKFANYSKILGLIIKCILKLTKALEQLASQIQPEKILLKSHLYLSEFATDPAKLLEDIGVKTIKTILNELSKLYKEEIWEFYAKSVQSHPKQDNYIHKWISVILRPILAISNISSRHPNQNSPRTRGGMTENSNLQQESSQREIPVIKELIENLKRTDKFEEGVQQLYEILSQNPDHNLTPYFHDCSKNFVEYVTLALERLQKTSQSNGSQQNQVDNESKLQMRTIGLQNRMNIPPTSQYESSKDSIIAQNLEDMQSKRHKYKARFGLLYKTNNENQVVNVINPNQGGLAVGNRAILNSNANPLNQLSNQEPPQVKEGEGTDTSPILATGENVEGNRAIVSTESLLKKLSEMKLRVASIVKTENNSN